MRTLWRFYKMKYIKPKTNKKKVDWKISENTLTILSYYRKYTQYTEEEVVDMFMENLLGDNQFVEWIGKQRFKKKIETLLKECSLIEELEGGDKNDKTEKINIT